MAATGGTNEALAGPLCEAVADADPDAVPEASGLVADAVAEVETVLTLGAAAVGAAPTEGTGAATAAGAGAATLPVPVLGAVAAAEGVPVAGVVAAGEVAAGVVATAVVPAGAAAVLDDAEFGATTLVDAEAPALGAAAVVVVAVVVAAVGAGLPAAAPGRTSRMRGSRSPRRNSKRRPDCSADRTRAHSPAQGPKASTRQSGPKGDRTTTPLWTTKRVT